jgi:hypothetical protein
MTDPVPVGPVDIEDAMPLSYGSEGDLPWRLVFPCIGVCTIRSSGDCRASSIRLHLVQAM